MNGNRFIDTNVLIYCYTSSEPDKQRVATISDAVRLADRYGYSFYDSLIVAAALESGCSILYSEDMQSGQLIDGTLTIRSPFQ